MFTIGVTVVLYSVVYAVFSLYRISFASAIPSPDEKKMMRHENVDIHLSSKSKVILNLNWDINCRV